MSRSAFLDLLRLIWMICRLFVFSACSCIHSWYSVIVGHWWWVYRTIWGRGVECCCCFYCSIATCCCWEICFWLLVTAFRCWFSVVVLRNICVSFVSVGWDVGVYLSCHVLWFVGHYIAVGLGGWDWFIADMRSVIGGPGPWFRCWVKL